MTSETAIAAQSRRQFLCTVSAFAGGLALGFDLPAAPEARAAAADAAEVNVWVAIKPDDTVVIRIARSEMGQGTLTGLAQLVAEELDADWSKVTTEFPTPAENLARNRAWGDMSTGGSRGIRTSQDYVRKGGATARMMLLAAAANEWKVPPGELSVSKGVITHAGSGRSTTYGKVAAAAAKLEPPKDAKLKDPKDWIIAGKAMKRLDTADKLTGKQVYAIDLKLPGMLNAAIKQCPVFGGKVKSFDAAAVSGLKGVRHVLPVGDGAVAVVADTWWQAKTALDKLPVEWDQGPNASVSSETIAEKLKAGLDATEGVAMGQKVGDAAGAIAGAAKKLNAVYGSPYLNHATLEPMTCTALFTPERCEAWVPTQNGDASIAAVSEASGLPLAKCEVHKMMLGGGFGRRGFQDYTKQAVLIARQIPGTPVKLIWSREEDQAHGFYRPISQARLEGGLDADGNLVGLTMRISGPSILAAVAPGRMTDGVDKLAFQGLLADEYGYTIPNLTIDHAVRATHVPPGFWRGVNHNQNAVYMECFIDELAHAAGKDPLEFRRKLLKDHPKHLAVLEAVAERAGWGKPAPEGVFRGLCQNMGFGSYTAAVAEVSVSPDGKLKIHRIVAATDTGHAVNPGQIERQVEGSFVYGLSALLYGEMTVKDGRMVELNFDTYPVLRMAEMPVVETIIMPSGGFWGGVGEPTIAVAAPAVLNAIFAATGKRIRTLPLRHADLRRA